MKKYGSLLAIGVFISGLVMFNNNSYLQRLTQNRLYAAEHTNQPSDQTLYTCPMHPQIVREAPGQCPICDMDLVPQKSSVKGKEGLGEEAGIRIDPVTVQNMGVRVDKVKKGVIHRHVRTFGRVETPDDAFAVVNLKFSGWAEKVWADKHGAYVRKGDKLFAVYSPEVFSAQKEYVLALKNFGGSHAVTQSAENRLRLWDVPDWQIRAIRDEMSPRRLLTISSPASGFIEHVDVVEGSRIASGKDLYTIVSLEKVWLKAEVYDFDAPWIKEGAEVQIDFAIPGFTSRKGNVSFIYPTLNLKTRTLTVRVELENPDMHLKPGMIASILIYGHSEDSALIIPSESIINTGKRKIVFVTTAPGKYEPREVETGLVGDNYVTGVVSGVEEGETVVTSGQFLLDSESQLQEAVKKFLETQLQSTGSRSQGNVEEKRDTESRKEVYTCPMHPQIIQEQPGQCPICGMDLVRKKK